MTLRLMRVEQKAAELFADVVEERDLSDYDKALGVA